MDYWLYQLEWVLRLFVAAISVVQSVPPQIAATQ